MRCFLMLSLLLFPFGMISKSQSLDLPTLEEQARLDSLFMHRLQLSGYYDSISTYKVYYIYTYHLKDKNLSKDVLKQGNLLEYLEKSYSLSRIIYPDSYPPIVYCRDEYKVYRDSIYTYGYRKSDSTMINDIFTFILDSICEDERIYNPTKFNDIRTEKRKTNIPKIITAIIENVDKHIFYTWNYWAGPWFYFDKASQSEDAQIVTWLKNTKYELILFVNPGTHGFYVAITRDKEVLFFNIDNNREKLVKRIDIEEYLESLWFLDF